MRVLHSHAELVLNELMSRARQKQHSFVTMTHATSHLTPASDAYLFITASQNPFCHHIMSVDGNVLLAPTASDLTYDR